LLDKEFADFLNKSAFVIAFGASDNLVWWVTHGQFDEITVDESAFENKGGSAC